MIKSDNRHISTAYAYTEPNSLAKYYIEFFSGFSNQGSFFLEPESFPETLREANVIGWYTAQLVYVLH